jgi:tRNA(Arg) A34 adenosine deaminase TadA
MRSVPTHFTQFTLSLPEWAVEENERLPRIMPTVEERMDAVIRFSRLNMEHDTGGPFAAGVFNRNTGERIIIGVNRVVASSCSSAHAEVMTLSVAQQILGTYDLGGANMPVYQLVVNWRPCVMCYGATLWSGIRSLVIAGSGPELEQITGFDEGPIHPEWEEELAKRGIELIPDILTDKAVEVFHEFAARKRLVYNSRQGSM